MSRKDGHYQHLRVGHHRMSSSDYLPLPEPVLTSSSSSDNDGDEPSPPRSLPECATTESDTEESGGYDDVSTDEPGSDDYGIYYGSNIEEIGGYDTHDEDSGCQGHEIAAASKLEYTIRVLIQVKESKAAGLLSSAEASTLKGCLASGDPKRAVLVKRVIDASRGEDENNFVAAFAHAASHLYNTVFRNCSLSEAKLMSRGEREASGTLGERSLIYGEVGFRSFLSILKRCQPYRKGKFYDLGSGTGRAIFTALLATDFSSLVGIEIMSSLHEASVRVLNSYNRHMRLLVEGSRAGSRSVEFIRGSFLHEDWSDGDFVFANSTCFEDELLETVGQRAVNLKPGSVIVTFTRGFEFCEHLELVSRFKMNMSWGEATIFIHRRIEAEQTPSSPYGAALRRNKMRNAAQLKLPALEISRTEIDNSLPSSPFGAALLRAKRKNSPPNPPPPISTARFARQDGEPSSPHDAALLLAKRRRGPPKSSPLSPSKARHRKLLDETAAQDLSSVQTLKWK